MRNFSLIVTAILVSSFVLAQSNTEATAIVKQANETLEQINLGPQFKTMRKSVSLFAKTNPPSSDQKKSASESK